MLAILLCSVLGIASAYPQTVFISSQSPSNLYINTAHGKTQVTPQGFNKSSDIIQLVLYPTDTESSKPQEAVVTLGGGIQGTITLIQREPPVGDTEIAGMISGLTPGLHGFHIHMTGNLTGGCKSTGGHFNPFEQHHGAQDAQVRHVGDLGNIEANEAGIADVFIRDKHVSLVGPNSVIGRAIVVHEKADDLGLGGDHGSRTTGNAGGRVGCGVIGRA